MGQQLSQLSDRVAELQAALAAGKQREQQLEAQLGATRAKVRSGIVLSGLSFKLEFAEHAEHAS
jgi:multidrug efflux pump subunit AcrA (membrane-fusion protein)